MGVTGNEEPMTTDANAAPGPPMSVSPPPPSVRAVQIPEELAKALESRIAGTGFASIDEFVAFVLARLSEPTAGEPFSEEEERRLRERLRSLGYID